MTDQVKDWIHATCGNRLHSCKCPDLIDELQSLYKNPALRMELREQARKLLRDRIAANQEKIKVKIKENINKINEIKKRNRL